MFNNPVFVKSWLLNTNQLIIIPKKKEKKTINCTRKKNFKTLTFEKTYFDKT